MATWPYKHLPPPGKTLNTMGAIKAWGEGKLSMSDAVAMTKERQQAQNNPEAYRIAAQQYQTEADAEAKVAAEAAKKAAAQPNTEAAPNV